jgi:hypothetical protein
MRTEEMAEVKSGSEKREIREHAEEHEGTGSPALFSP